MSEIVSHGFARVNLINFVSIDLCKTDVWRVLQMFGTEFDCGLFAAYADTHGKYIENRLHVTYAHHKYSSQYSMKEKFEKFVGATVYLKIKAIYFAWNESHGKNIAALECTQPYFKDKGIESAVGQYLPYIYSIGNKRSFPHITVWLDKDTKPYMSNDLPELYHSGTAQKVDLETPIELPGVISYVQF